jgi:hypothetical protein
MESIKYFKVPKLQKLTLKNILENKNILTDEVNNSEAKFIIFPKLTKLDIKNQDELYIFLENMNLFTNLTELTINNRKLNREIEDYLINVFLNQAERGKFDLIKKVKPWDVFNTWYISSRLFSELTIPQLREIIPKLIGHVYVNKRDLEMYLTEMRDNVEFGPEINDKVRQFLTYNDSGINKKKVKYK